jgi:uncharacterized membrane protein
VSAEPYAAPAAAGLAKARVEALADGIFAVAMTLLILDVKVPAVAHPAELAHELLALWPKCLSYLISFVMLGVYWVGHHAQFHLIRHTDRVLLWINILFLMSISFVPFSTALLSTYPHQQLAVGVYGSNLILTGLILYAHWSYATGARRLIDRDLDAGIVRFASRRILIGPAMFALAIAVSFFATGPSLLIFLCAPLVYLLPGKIDRHWS